jgi:cytochrome c-type biogenesis protein
VEVNGLIAFFAGVGSFFSPCVLPLVPSFLIYISGATVHDFNDLSEAGCRNRVLSHSVSFIAGFSFVFIALGISSSFLGSLFSSSQRWIMVVGGVVLIIMGLNMLGLFTIPFLNREKIITISRKPSTLFGSFIVGVTFSLGWTPCIGPVLASILIIAATDRSVLGGLYLLGLYSLGLAIPFFIAAVLVARLMNLMRRFSYVVRYTSLILGALLVVIGALLVTGYFTTVTKLLG